MMSEKYIKTTFMLFLPLVIALMVGATKGQEKNLSVEELLNKAKNALAAGESYYQKFRVTNNKTDAQLAIDSFEQVLNIAESTKQNYLENYASIARERIRTIRITLAEVELHDLGKKGPYFTVKMVPKGVVVTHNFNINFGEEKLSNPFYDIIFVEDVLGSTGNVPKRDVYLSSAAATDIAKYRLGIEVSEVGSGKDYDRYGVMNTLIKFHKTGYIDIVLICGERFDNRWAIIEYDLNMPYLPARLFEHFGAGVEENWSEYVVTIYPQKLKVITEPTVATSQIQPRKINRNLPKLAFGSHHSLNLKTDGSVVAWGDNDHGQCNVPSPNTGFLAVAAGYGHSLGLKTDGSVVAWGDNDHGQCNVPSPNSGFVAIAAGESHSLGLKADGSIVAWGWNVFGQCHIPDPNTGFVAIAAGGSHSLGLKADGSVVAWGYNLFHQCSVPSPNSGFVAIAAGYGCDHCLGLKADGSIVAWGRNWEGQCNVPSPNSDFVAIAAGHGHSLGLKADGSIAAWGNNGDGQCNMPSPNTGFVAIAAGYLHSLGLKADGSIAAWGNNEYGQCNVVNEVGKLRKEAEPTAKIVESSDSQTKLNPIETAKKFIEAYWSLRIDDAVNLVSNDIYMEAFKIGLLHGKEGFRKYMSAFSKAPQFKILTINEEARFDDGTICIIKAVIQTENKVETTQYLWFKKANSGWLLFTPSLSQAGYSNSDVQSALDAFIHIFSLAGSNRSNYQLNIATPSTFEYKKQLWLEVEFDSWIDSYGIKKQFGRTCQVVHMNRIGNSWEYGGAIGGATPIGRN